ncbi:hypothetical protein JD77_05904 [Micromonospora olivasterospora]|uniref:Uncharacterized protein n=1 Tax=Micromonospora olivasterospora TaxID=1880 RepID=A0A562IIM4_MICOL|nr:hypothetical protein JD77_05904 [Micromonospora olivasterospora]
MRRLSSINPAQPTTMPNPPMVPVMTGTDRYGYGGIRCRNSCMNAAEVVETRQRPNP